jgi:hypothetical protein
MELLSLPEPTRYVAIEFWRVFSLELKKMIDLKSETLAPLNEVRFPLPKQPGPQTRWRFSSKGVRIPGTDQRVILETVKLGGARMTTQEAVLRFIAAANPAAVPVITEAQRRGQHEAATACLRAAGVI